MARGKTGTRVVLTRSIGRMHATAMVAGTIVGASIFVQPCAVHPRFRTPHAAIVSQAVWSSVLAFTGTHPVLFTRVVYTDWMFFAALAIGALRLRRTARFAPGFHARGFPVAPLVFVLASLAIVVNQIASDPRESAMGLVLVGAALPVYAICKRLDKGAVVHAGC